MPTQSNSNTMSPSAIMILRNNIPSRREIKFMIMKLAKSSKLNLSPRCSVMRFQGEKKELVNCFSEKKLTVNQKKFNQICSISRKALV